MRKSIITDERESDIARPAKAKMAKFENDEDEYYDEEEDDQEKEVVYEKDYSDILWDLDLRPSQKPQIDVLL